jgi:hypothetical protein
MKGDFTRNTYSPNRHISRVLMQQGRVMLDADFNEQAAIIIDNFRKLAMDIGGVGWGPAGNCGFGIKEIKDNIITINQGRYYVDGILCENEQDGFPIVNRKITEGRNYYVYLDVWERHITYVQDDFIREAALNGPDTCSRAKIIWQVMVDEAGNNSANAGQKAILIEQKAKLISALNGASGVEKRKIQEQIKLLEEKLAALGNGTFTCSDLEAYLDNLRTWFMPLLAVRLQDDSSNADECSLPPESHYRGLENQLYRFEIHTSGFAWDGTMNNGIPGGNVADAATFKWSRDNGSIVFPIVRQQGAVATLQTLGRDERTGLKIGDWVEIIDNEKELAGRAGIMAQIDKLDLVEMTATLKLPDEDTTTSWPSYIVNPCIAL